MQCLIKLIFYGKIMKRLIFVLLSFVSTIMAIACDAEYVEQAHRQGKAFIIVAAVIAFLSWIIGLWNRLGSKTRFLSRSFGLMIAFNLVVIGVGNLLEEATDYNDSPMFQFFFFLMLLLPIIDIIWIILTFVWNKKAHQRISKEKEM